MADYHYYLECGNGYYVKVNEETHLVADVSYQQGAKFKIITQQNREYLYCLDNDKYVQQSQSSDFDIEASASQPNQYSLFTTKSISGEGSYHGVISQNGKVWQADSSDQHVRANGDPNTLQSNKNCWFLRSVAQ